MRQSIPKENGEQYIPISSISLNDIESENDAVQQSTQILFDMGNIDPFRESVEHDTTSAEQIAEEDTESVSSASYRAIPTSISLERQSETDFDDDDIEDIDMDYDRGLPNRVKVHLPAMEIVIQNLGIQQERLKAQGNTESKPKEAHTSDTDTQDIDYTLDTPVDSQLYNSSLNNLDKDVKDVSANYLGPREQEEADEPVRKGMKYLFDNKFLKAKALFQKKNNSDPLYALGLGAMTFIKAMMTYNEDDIQLAMDTLTISYNIAKIQIDHAAVKKPYKSTWSSYLSTMVSSNQTGLPNCPPVETIKSDDTSYSNEGPQFLPNGVLRANVVKAESCLLMGMLQMTQESVVGYLKCGLNLRKAYGCYTIVWQEYKRMGQEYTKYMDRDTVSAIQFGIGTVHLLVSSLPPKILKIFSSLGFKSDKQLGFALLKLCLEGRGIRSPLASLVLLTYFSILSSFAPQLYAGELMEPAVECLINAQKSHPSSCFFLFYAARISRIARNLPLSTQSFTFAVDSSQGEWAHAAMSQMGNYEIGFNFALQLDWVSAEVYFEKLSQEKYYWSPAFCQYFIGACRGMLGKRTDSILAFAEVPQLVKDQKKKSYIDIYVKEKVEFFQKSGYQDMDFCLPGLELLLVWNAFDQMQNNALEACLLIVQNTLELIYEREKLEYNIRLHELVPATNPPDYYDQRAILLLIKASILNALKRHNDSIAHLNWIIDHKIQLKSETWIIPFTYWESGVTSWGLKNYEKSRWQCGLAWLYQNAMKLALR
ncbi:hypothetical protein [Parasitella parasitica]|uniref:Tetratricopeptide repeat protein 39C n=1 Tax=Parasitella parasitica TaxID=35722 RepID=A0A0B7NBV0_9FUNG|nr:hypothetical protein [Parasitella parasitica]